MSYQFRRCEPSDKDFVISLHHETLREYIEPIHGWDEPKWTEMIANWFSPEKIQIIQSEKQDIGLLVLNEKEKQIHFESISLLPAFQGRGIGSAIIKEIKDKAANNSQKIVLSVLRTNEGAKKLYETLDFKVFDQDEENFYLSWS